MRQDMRNVRKRTSKETTEKERTAHPTLTLALLLALCVAGWALECLEGPAAAETPAAAADHAEDPDEAPAGAFLTPVDNDEGTEDTEATDPEPPLVLLDDVEGSTAWADEVIEEQPELSDGESSESFEDGAGGDEAWPAEGAELVIVPHLRGEARRRHDEAMSVERERLRQATAAWCPGFIAAVHPVREAADRAAASLAQGWGPISRNVAYPLQVALEELGQSGSLPAPDPAVEKRLRKALAALSEGAAACAQGLPTTARTNLEAGRRGLAEVEAGLVGCGSEGLPEL